MFFNNKGMQSHIAIVFIVSLIMAILIVSVLSPFFKVDHKNCLDYDFEIEKKCLDGDNIKFIVKNKVEKMIYFNVSGEKVFELNPMETKDFKYTSSEGTVDIVLFFYGSIDKKVYECSSLKETINPGRILKC
ncbi:MAG: hypothetical protein PF569_09575 [Candidatus Woesearchaeota archaeon]|jgi:hypothetical protein|nr:hypothetical protein [Candidatus Woesearchaeota archaeon]